MTVHITEKPRLRLNPWTSIWFKPRQTIREVVSFNPGYGVVLLAVMTGIYRFLNQASKRSLGDNLSLGWIIILSLTIGTIGGFLYVYFTGSYMRWVGSWFGGTATTVEARAAVAWSSIPDGLLLIIFVPILLLFREAWFSSTFYENIEPATTLWIFSLLVPLGMIVLIWRIVLFVACLAEVHRFSVWRSVFVSALGVVILLVPAFFVILLLN